MSAVVQHQRDYLAKKRLQLRIALAYLAVIAAGSAVTVAILLSRLLRVLKFEMYRGHSTAANTWEIVSGHVLLVNAAVTAVVLLAAVAIALVILASVHRAARHLCADVRAALAGGAPSAWVPLRRPREFRHLQKLVAAGIESHRERLAQIDGTCAAILDLARAMKGGSGGHHDLRRLHVLCERLRSQVRHIRAE